MRNMTKTLAVLAVSALALTSCKKNANQSENQISQETLTKIYDHGFGTSNVQQVEGGYLVEGDILLTDEYLNTTPGGYFLRIADVEQYRTTNTVSSGGSRVITVSASGDINANVSAAIDGAISRYNAVNLTISFLRVTSGGAINVKVVKGGPYIASSGFPTGGNPYPEVKFNRQYQNWTLNTLTSVMAHEIGHCIGFRHTDYMDRSYSCGGSPTNEGASSVGAVHIAGTPTGPDAGSWMLACIGNGINRPFNTNDKTALTTVY
jgi:hypothetical protein